MARKVWLQKAITVSFVYLTDIFRDLSVSSENVRVAFVAVNMMSKSMCVLLIS